MEDITFDDKKYIIKNDDNIDNPCLSCDLYLTKQCVKVNCNGKYFIEIKN